MSKLVAILIPIFLGFSFGAGSFIVAHEGRLDFSSPEEYIYSIVFTLCFVFLFELTHRLTPFVHSRSNRLSRKSGLQVRGVAAISFDWKLRDILLCSAILLFCWLPHIIALYPGIYWHDTSWQVVRFFQEGQLSAWQPPFVTVVFGICAALGIKVFGNAFIGLFGLIILQALLACISLATGICYLSKWNAGKGVRVALVVFFALFPMFPWFFAGLAKDTICTPFFILFYIAIAELVRTKGDVLHSRRHIVGLCVICIVLVLTKKIELYVIGDVNYFAHFES